MIDFDRKGEPIWEQVPVSHAEIVGFRPVVALGNFYVVNGKIAYKHPSGRWGIDHYSDYNCNRKEQQKSLNMCLKNMD
ncbi:MAG: hypothetical protein HWD59_05695 [Coxiellaceae bacterium]|nr:MAG: hypothetical protein HWD59_05695 [Coxiellaceae bacterium]